MIQWNVYIGDFNGRCIRTFNIFRHTAFTEGCQKIIKKYQKAEKAEGVFNRDAFSDEIRRELMYYFWSKCEWEVIIDHWPPHESFKSEKVDVFDQVRLNWDVFIDYIWDNKNEIKKLCMKT